MSAKEQAQNDFYVDKKIACTDCVHFNVGKIIPSCNAFLVKIPDIIWKNGDPHTKSIEGDNGITYQKIT